jgi:putative ABC transport system permease protein
VFYLSYLRSELLRRRGRTLLTALGLGIGVGLVVTVSALSKGLDQAQDEVLKPLTGVGTDLSVTRPINPDSDSGDGAQAGGPAAINISPSEREALRKENGRPRFGLTRLGEPGERFERTDFVTTQLSFPASQIAKIRSLEGVDQVSGGLTVNAIQVSGKVPEETGGQFQAGPGAGPPTGINFKPASIAGVDTSPAALGAISGGQVTRGRFLRDDSSHEAVLNVAYARREGITVGETIELKNTKFKVVGLAETPIGGQASDIYLKLGQLQRLSDKEGRVNTLYVRADDSGAVGDVQRSIEMSFPGSQVTTSKDLADRVGGSLVDAKDLASSLGTALSIVALAGAFLIACLLTLSSVAKRTRELGTLKALGWPQRLVVRQVTGEALAQGAIGGLVGAVIGIAGAALIGAIGPTLEASVAAAAQAGPGPIGPGAFGQGSVTAGSTSVSLDAPIDAGLVLLAIGLALLGGLLAGAAGAARSARLRPAEALRHID